VAGRHQVSSAQSVVLRKTMGGGTWGQELEVVRYRDHQNRDLENFSQHVPCWSCKFPPFLFPTFTFVFSSPPPSIFTSLHLHLPSSTYVALSWLGVTQQRWTWCSTYRSLTLVSANASSLTAFVCARPATLEFGLRTIPSVVSSFL